jgi:hypothetical protein
LSDQPLVQSLEQATVASAWVGSPRCAVGRFPGCAVFPRPATPETVKLPVSPLFELGLRLRHFPANPSQAARGRPAPPMSFRRPTAHQARKVHSTRALPARYVPPPGFGYPLDGLLPSRPCRLCFAPTALLGFTLRSLTSLEVPRASPHGSTHLPFSPSLRPAPQRRPGTMGRGSWASTPQRVPDAPAGG